MHGEDKPDDRIIEDDQRLDEWYEKYAIARDRRMQGKQSTVAYSEVANALPSFKPA